MEKKSKRNVKKENNKKKRKRKEKQDKQNENEGKIYFDERDEKRVTSSRIKQF